MYKKIGVYIVGGILFVLAPVAHAATLGITPGATSVPNGEVVSLSVVVSSDTAVNAVTASVKFSQDTLTLISASHSGSALTLWVEEPSYSNAAGTAQWSGIAPNPGVTGTKRILTLQFRAKKEGSGSVSITSAQVLANDGNGTDVYSGSSGARITIGPALPKSQAPAQAPTPTPAQAYSNAPTITDFRDTVQVGEPIVIRGKDAPTLSVVTMHFFTDHGEILGTTTADTVGAFTYIKKQGLEEGLYSFQADAQKGSLQTSRSQLQFIQVVKASKGSVVSVSMPLLYIIGGVIILLLLAGLMSHRHHKRKRKKS